MLVPMRDDAVRIGVESGARKTFVWVIDWPGWCRGAKTTAEAIDSIVEHGPRYAQVAREAGLALPELSTPDLLTAVAVTGGSGTDFGVPSAITDDDRRPVSAEEAERLAALVEAAWTAFDRVVAAAPAELRKGPRGGGRDRDKVAGHVDQSDQAYAGVMGIKVQAPDRADASTLAAMRRPMLEVLRQPSDGSPIAGRKWPPRYAARRIAWHALDHAWEIEDRTES
jgi:hypothetical protein